MIHCVLHKNIIERIEEAIISTEMMKGKRVDYVVLDDKEWYELMDEIGLKERANGHIIIETKPIKRLSVIRMGFMGVKINNESTTWM